MLLDLFTDFTHFLCRFIKFFFCFLDVFFAVLTISFSKDWNIINPEQLLGKDDVIVKIRYRKQENRCTVTLSPDNTLHIQLHDPLTAIAPGQAAAFYRDDVVLGGGIIVEEKEKTRV